MPWILGLGSLTGLGLYNLILFHYRLSDRPTPHGFMV